jgi:hypothetical protein
MTRACCAVTAGQAGPPITLCDWRALRPFGQGPQPFPVAPKPREAASTPRRARWASDPSGGKIGYR